MKKRDQHKDRIREIICQFEIHQDLEAARNDLVKADIYGDMDPASQGR